ncbi:hypothetical protein CBM2595_A81195 [Cupriavidus taiwanensis]|nr:hypothetical protein CBM2595_A81195 [Cupriavidus taiwanensis]
MEPLARGRAVRRRRRPGRGGGGRRQPAGHRPGAAVPAARRRGPGLGAADAVAVRADPRGRAHLGGAVVARRARTRRRGAGARSGPGLRHRQPPHHAAVHAVAGAEPDAGRNRAGLRLRLRHPGDRRAQAGRGRHGRHRYRSQRGGSVALQRRAQPRRGLVRAAGIGVRCQLRPGGRQHPVQSAQADGGHAQRARARRRPAGAVRRAGAPGRGSRRGLRALAAADGVAQRGRLGLPARHPPLIPPDGRRQASHALPGLPHRLPAGRRPVAAAPGAGALRPVRNGVRRARAPDRNSPAGWQHRGQRPGLGTEAGSACLRYR